MPDPSLFPAGSDGPFAAMLGRGDGMAPPGWVPRCAHARWREIAGQVMRERPGASVAEVREEAGKRLEKESE